jgi:hypothetical protein
MAITTSCRPAAAAAVVIAGLMSWGCASPGSGPPGAAGGGGHTAGAQGGAGDQAGVSGGQAAGAGQPGAAGNGGGDGGALDSPAPRDAPPTGESRPADAATEAAAGPDAINFRLSYSTAGYDARGTKVVLIRTLAPVAVSDVDLAETTWSLTDARGGAATTGRVTYFGTTYGVQYWVADFSAFRGEGQFSMEVTIKKSADTLIGVKRTLPFWVQNNNFTRTMLIPLSLNNADARKAPPAKGGFYDATSVGFQEAYSHGMFLYGLLQMYKFRYAALSDADKVRLVTDIDIAFDHLLRRWSPDATTLFAHPEVGTRGGMNDVEPSFAMALYVDMFKGVDPTRANDANFAKVVTAFNLLTASPAAWLAADYQEYKDYLISMAVHMYRYSGDVTWKNEAITRLGAFLAAFNLRTHYRSASRVIPLFDGLRACAEEFPADASYATWISQATTIKDTYYKSGKVWAENAFHIVSTSAAKDPAGDWDAARITGDAWGNHIKGYTGGTYAHDVLVLAKLTGDRSLEKVAAGELYWDMGLNPGLPQAYVVNPTSAGERESASFIINAPFRHVTGVTYRDFKMLNDTYMTTVNGFNSNGGANEFGYVGTVGYNGEDFIKHDGALINGGLIYEEYLASIQ